MTRSPTDLKSPERGPLDDSEALPPRPIARILLIEDDEVLRQGLGNVLTREGYAVSGAATLAQARETLAREQIDVIIVDRVLPDGDGVRFALEEELPGEPEVMVVTGTGTVQSVIEALKHGVTDYLLKPLDHARLRKSLAQAIEARSLKRENRALRSAVSEQGRFGDIITQSAAMESVVNLVLKVAPTDATVLLIGESGTGKEVVARTIHRFSSRRDKPLIPVNCGAITESLMESELFGHERGSFTGADKRRPGYFEQADGGTLFLDEITEMPLNLQVKLLRVLETQSYRRVGGNQTLSASVRIIAATNRNPPDAVREGKLRKDLFYRLSVFPITLPVLDERKGDVRLLARHFLDGLNKEHGSNKLFSSEALARLEQRSWPGNVRELKNAVHQAFILANDSVVEDIGTALPATDLDPGRAGRPAGEGDEKPSSAEAACSSQQTPTVPAATNPEAGDRTLELPRAWTEMPLRGLRKAVTADLERMYLHAQLRETGGSIRQTAERCGIGPRALNDLMRRHGLTKEDYRA